LFLWFGSNELGGACLDLYHASFTLPSCPVSKVVTTRDAEAKLGAAVLPHYSSTQPGISGCLHFQLKSAMQDGWLHHRPADTICQLHKHTQVIEGLLETSTALFDRSNIYPPFTFTFKAGWGCGALSWCGDGEGGVGMRVSANEAAAASARSHPVNTQRPQPHPYPERPPPDPLTVHTHPAPKRLRSRRRLFALPHPGLLGRGGGVLPIHREALHQPHVSQDSARGVRLAAQQLHRGARDRVEQRLAAAGGGLVLEICLVKWHAGDEVPLGLGLEARDLGVAGGGVGVKVAGADCVELLLLQLDQVAADVGRCHCDGEGAGGGGGERRRTAAAAKGGRWRSARRSWAAGNAVQHSHRGAVSLGAAGCKIAVLYRQRRRRSMICDLKRSWI